MSIQKREGQLRKDGTRSPTVWRVFYIDPSGEERNKTFYSRREAKEFDERNGASIQAGEWVSPEKFKSKFETWGDDWWRSTVRLRPNTRAGYWRHYNLHVLPYFKGRPVGSITKGDVSRFVTDKLTQGLSPKYVGDSLTVLSAILQAAVDDKARLDNPVPGQKLYPKRKKVKRGQRFSMEQVIAFIRQVHAWYRPAVWTSIYGTLRPAELCGALICNLDFQTGQLDIERTYGYVQPFGPDGAGEMVEGETKTEASDRDARLPRWLLDQILDTLKVRGLTPGSHEPLFVNLEGRRINLNTMRAKIIRPALVRAGLPESFRTYDLRHTSISMLIDLGANITAVSEYAGHSEHSITVDVYGHPEIGYQNQIMSLLDEHRQATEQALAGRAEIIPFTGRRAAPRQDSGKILLRRRR